MLSGYRHHNFPVGDRCLARRELPDCPHLATSEGRNWLGVRLDEYGAFHATTPEPMPPRDHHVVLIARGHSSYVFQKRFGEVFESAFKPGDMMMIPAGNQTTFRGRLAPHLRIGLSVDILTEAVQQLGRSGTCARPQLKNVFRVEDQCVERLAGIYSSELLQVSHPTQDMLIEYITMALLAHLLRSYGVSIQAHDGSAGSNAAAMRRVMEFMNQPLDSRISLSELAAVSGISRFHLSRIFKKQFGMSPIAYLENTRIERAKALIQRADMSLAEVAQTVGFADQSHFTRRFKHYAGATPGAYAREHARARSLFQPHAPGAAGLR